MVDTAVLFGADESKAKEEMTEVLKFEMKLAKISTLKELRRDATRVSKTDIQDNGYPGYLEISV